MSQMPALRAGRAPVRHAGLRVTDSSWQPVEVRVNHLQEGKMANSDRKDQRLTAGLGQCLRAVHFGEGCQQGSGLASRPRVATGRLQTGKGRASAHLPACPLRRHLRLF